MFGFRSKIFITYILAFLIFLALIFPFSKILVNKIVSNGMEVRADEIKDYISSSPTDDSLVRRTKELKDKFFFRVTIVTEDFRVLYDSHTKRQFGPKFSEEIIVLQPEITDAFAKGVGQGFGYSDLLNEQFYYLAKAFDFHDKKYVIRLSFPYDYISDLIRDFTFGFMLFTTAILFFFSVMTWLVIHRLTQPIQQIIQEVRPFQTGEVDELPFIKLKSVGKKSEFARLANTLNSLSSRIKRQINALVHERNEREVILESLGEGVVAVNRHLTVQYANRVALKFFKKRKENLIGKNLTTTEDKNCVELLQSCRSQNKMLSATYSPKKGGAVTYYDLVASPIKGESKGAVLVLKDRTSHYGIMQMRKDFIANASHELKTPITIIQGFAETLHDNSDLPPETLNQITGKILKNCQRMTRLIKDLLTLADIENLPSSKLVKTDLITTLNENRQLVQSVFPEAKITIHSGQDEEYTLIGEPGLLDLAFMNLINNAAKYSTPPATIDIFLSKTEHSIEVIVADKGIGIPEEDLKFIFHRFYTVDKAHSQKMGGSGLGLSIVETIIKKHYGNISVTSEAGKGTTFTVRLPLDQNAL